MPVSLPAVLADAHDTNYPEFSTGYAPGPGSEVHRDTRFDRVIIDLPVLPYNEVSRPSPLRGRAGAVR